MSCCRLTASVCPAPFQPTLDPVEFVLTFPALAVQSCARAITSRPLWALPASSVIGVGTVATGAVFMPLSIVFGYSEVGPPLLCCRTAAPFADLLFCKESFDCELL